MPLSFEIFGKQHLSAVRDFNQRMETGDAASDFLLPEKLETPRTAPGDPIEWTRYVVLEGAEVRGGLLAMTQPGWLNGEPVRIVNFQSPLSESVIDPKYSVVAMQMVKFMQKQADAVFMVGMGAIDRPLPKLLMAAGWNVRPVPFLFRVHRVGSFLRELRMLRTSPVKRIGASFGRFTGVGSIALAYKQRQKAAVNGSLRQVNEWGDWADEIWRSCREQCSFAVMRDRRTLASLYPLSDRRTRIYVVEHDGRAIGWSVCFNTRLEDHRHFGNLQVGSILDCLAVPDGMATTAILTDRALSSDGAELVLVNHSHTAWIEAFRAAGFLSGPSNYMLAMPKKLVEALRSAPEGESRVHITRGDGDGRIHLAE